MPSTTISAADLQALQSDYSELAKFPEHNPGPVCRLDLEGNVLLANAATRALFGFTDVRGVNWLDICPGMTRTVWDEILARDAPLTREIEIGSRCIQFTYLLPDTRHSVFGYGADVTDLRRAERDLAEKSAALAEVARFPEMNPGPAIRIDVRGAVLLANPAAHEVLGDDLVGRSWMDLCPGVDEATWRRLVASTEPIPVEARIGEKHFVFTHRFEPLSQLLFVYGADVTQQKRAEVALRQSDKMATLGTLAAGVAHELNNPAAATRRAADQLRNAISGLERAHLGLEASGLTAEERARLAPMEKRAREHAVRRIELDAVTRSDRESAIEEWLEERGIDDPWDLAPALVAMNYDPAALDALAVDVRDAIFPAVVAWLARVFPVHALLRELSEGAGRISEIVGALKSYSYLGQAPEQFVNVHEGIDDTLVILRNKLKTGITVRSEYASGLPLIPVYGSELNQVWTNLIDNAADAMNGKGTIVIRTRREDAWVVVEIEDDGPGIPPDIQTRIFDPFFTTKGPGKGTGLGLSTSYNIVTEKHRGSIDVVSRPGMTRFTVRLPVAGEHDAPARPPEPGS